MEEEVILEARGISVSFGRLQALKDVSLKVRKGEILGLIGPNGAGKTVLLNCISGLYRPDHGLVFFQGRQINGLPLHKIASLGIARTFQQVELFPHMSVIANVLVGRHARMKTNVFSGGVFWGWGVKEEEFARRKVEEILDFLELYHYRKEKIANLGFGSQKLIGLARALAMEPKILLLDEVASGLNREEKEDLARFLLRIKYEQRIPMLWVEHDMELITQLGDRIACLYYGNKIAEGTPVETVSNPDVIKAYLGKEGRSD
jgi:branched-chain amino acid transport system ATP-binding protein